jgi:hypothetical protein
MAIWMAASYGKSVDSRKSEAQKQRCRKGGIKVIYTDAYDNPYDNPLLADDIKYRPDVLAIDKIAYQDFRNSLSCEESTLLDVMIDSSNNGQKGRGGFKTEFIHRTGSTYSNYEAVHMSLLRKYYHHYGSEQEKEDFEQFFRHWRPRTPMYHGRSNQNGVQ